MKISPLMWTAAVLATLALAGCGKRPGHLDLPDDVPNDHFPHFYPNPKLDPQADAQQAKAPVMSSGSATMLNGMNNTLANGLILNDSVMNAPTNQGPMMGGGGGSMPSISSPH